MLQAKMIAGGVIGLIAIAVVASKATTAPAKPKTPKTPVRPTVTTVGLPADVQKIIKGAMASNDPKAIRDAAFKIADKYALQAADLLSLATILESEPEPAASTGGATGAW